MKKMPKNIQGIGFSLVVLVSFAYMQADTTDLDFIQECQVMVGAIEDLGNATSSNPGVIAAASAALSCASDAVSVVVSSPGASAAVRAAASTVLDVVTSAFTAVASNSNVGADTLFAMATQSGIGAAALDAVVLSTSALPKHLNATVFQNKTASAAALSSSLAVAVQAANTLKTCAHNGNFNAAHYGNVASALLNVGMLYNYVVYSNSFTAQSDIDAAGNAAISIIAVLDDLATLFAVYSNLGSQVNAAHAALQAFASFSILSGYTYTGSGTVAQMKTASGAMLAYIGQLMNFKSIIEFRPNNINGPEGITVGGDSNIWYANAFGNNITKMSLDGGNVTSYALNDYPIWIATGADGNVWFTLYSNSQIGKITPNGVISYYSITSDYGEWGNHIVLGSDGNIWFTESNGNLLGKITPNGVVTEYAVTGCWGIAAGPDNNIWFTDINNNMIGMINVNTFQVNYYSTKSFRPAGIASGPDGNLWFIVSNANKIGSISPNSGVITYYDLPVGSTDYDSITTGQNGLIWLTNAWNNSCIYVFDPTTKTNIKLVVPSHGAPEGIIVGPDKNMWVSVFGSSRIAKITVL